MGSETMKPEPIDPTTRKEVEAAIIRDIPDEVLRVVIAVALRPGAGNAPPVGRGISSYPNPAANAIRWVSIFARGERWRVAALLATIGGALQILEPCRIM